MKKFFIPFLLIIICSCTSVKDLTYLNESKIDEESWVSQSYDLDVQKDDLLSINITSQSPDLVMPFMQGVFNSSSIEDNTRTENTFLVNSSGEINFPILGQIKVEGLTHKEVASRIENIIKDGGYINDPIVTVRLKNFKVIVLGDIEFPGVIDFESDRVTIFDAIASSRDINSTGKKKEVKIVRERDGKRTIALVDLTKADIFESPYYYLKQNDIIYVNPNSRSARSGQLVNNDRWFSVGLSMFTMLTSLLIGIFAF